MRDVLIASASSVTVRPDMPDSTALKTRGGIVPAARTERERTTSSRRVLVGGTTPNFFKAQETALATCALCPVAVPCAREALTPLPKVLPIKMDDPPPMPVQGIWVGSFPDDRKGLTRDDAEALVERTRRRAIDLGLAPEWVLEGAA